MPIDIVDNKLCKDYKYLSYVLLVFSWTTKLKTSLITFYQQITPESGIDKKTKSLGVSTILLRDNNNWASGLNRYKFFLEPFDHVDFHDIGLNPSAINSANNLR